VCTSGTATLRIYARRDTTDSDMVACDAGLFKCTDPSCSQLAAVRMPLLPYPPIAREGHHLVSPPNGRPSRLRFAPRRIAGRMLSWMRR
jgi:hypothetical protein